MIRAVVKEPRKNAAVRMIDTSLSGLQEIVGGYLIQCGSVDGLPILGCEDSIEPINVRAYDGRTYRGTLVVYDLDKNGNAKSIAKSRIPKVCELLNALSVKQ